MSIPAAPTLALETLGNLHPPILRGPGAGNEVHAHRTSFVASVLLGLAAGHRSMVPLAVLGLAPPRRGTVIPMLATLLGLTELVVDKLPFVPDRTSALPALVRSLSGATAGGIATRRARRSTMAGAMIGGAAAVGATQLGFRLRRAAERALPPLAAALLEDALAVAMASAGARLSRRAPAR